MYYTFNPIRYCGNSSENSGLEIPDSPFTRIDYHVYSKSDGFACNRGGACSITII